jgi:hypothetical protein
VDGVSDCHDILAAIHFPYDGKDIGAWIPDTIRPVVGSVGGEVGNVDAGQASGPFGITRHDDAGAFAGGTGKGWPNFDISRVMQTGTHNAGPSIAFIIVMTY